MTFSTPLVSSSILVASTLNPSSSFLLILFSFSLPLLLSASSIKPHFLIYLSLLILL